MTEKLGKIEKPEAEHFTGKRKVYLVPLIFSGEEAPPEYVERFNLYWEQAGEQVANLDSKKAKLSHVYHESINVPGENGLKAIEQLSPSSCQIARDKCHSGAQFEAAEDKDLADESVDWDRDLLIGFASQ